MRRVRGRADLKVSIEYPAERRGTYSVKISRKKNSGRRGPHITSPSAVQRAKRKAAASSKSERQLVSRETDFHGIPSGRWFVTVDGFMQPQDDDTVIGTYFEEQPVKLHRGHTVRVDFDFHPKQCPVDVKVVWSQKPVQDALLAWRGHPQSLRYTRGGPVRIGIERGSQMLMVGSGDRVAEISIEVISFQPISVEVDLADRDHLLFTGCPPAVEPYLHGDMPAAARALEREGKSEVSNLILARLHIERDQRGAAARHYAEAGRPADAASIHRTLENYEKAADLYEAAGGLEEAAQMWRKADSPERAGEVYGRGRELGEPGGGRGERRGGAVGEGGRRPPSPASKSGGLRRCISSWGHLHALREGDQRSIAAHANLYPTRPFFIPQGRSLSHKAVLYPTRIGRTVGGPPLVPIRLARAGIIRPIGVDRIMLYGIW